MHTLPADVSHIHLSPFFWSLLCPNIHLCNKGKYQQDVPCNRGNIFGKLKLVLGNVLVTLNDIVGNISVCPPVSSVWWPISIKWHDSTTHFCWSRISGKKMDSLLCRSTTFIDHLSWSTGCHRTAIIKTALSFNCDFSSPNNKYCYINVNKFLHNYKTILCKIVHSLYVDVSQGRF